MKFIIFAMALIAATQAQSSGSVYTRYDRAVEAEEEFKPLPAPYDKKEYVDKYNGHAEISTK